jgi:hypothetical protein
MHVTLQTFFFIMCGNNVLYYKKKAYLGHAVHTEAEVRLWDEFLDQFKRNNRHKQH